MFSSMKWPVIVAEIGASHNGDYNRVLDLIDAAHSAGADAVKFQTFTPDTMAVNQQIDSGPWKGRTYHDLYWEAMMPWSWIPGLFSFAKSLGLVAFSTPFSYSAVDFLEASGCPLYKIASPEICHTDLLRRVGMTQKPVVLSAGLASRQELDCAISTVHRSGSTEVVVLHCISAYPAKPEAYDLTALDRIRRAHPSVQVGLSDHTIGSAVAVAAVARGAMMVEKHLTLKRSDGGPDSLFSSEPNEFAAMVRDCRIAAAACSAHDVQEVEGAQYKRSLWVVKPITAGERFTRDNLAVLRPSNGLHPSRLSDILLRHATCGIPAGTALQECHIRGLENVGEVRS